MKINLPITIIMRTYNSEHFVKKAIKSVLNQTLSKKLYEIIVVDDGSSDNTLKILDSYKKKNIRIIKQDHQGAVKALNKGIKKSKGKYVIILDSDDVFREDILEKFYSVIRKEADFVYCDYKEKSVIGREKIVSLKNNIFESVASGIMFKKEIVDKFRGYDENMIFPEYDLLIKIMKEHKGVYVSESLFTYNRRKDSITGNSKTVQKGIGQLLMKYGSIKGLKIYET